MHPGVSLKLRIFAVGNWRGAGAPLRASADASGAGHHSTIARSTSITHGVIAGIGVGGVGCYDVADPSERPTRADPEARRDNEPQDAGQDAAIVELAYTGDYRAQDRRQCRITHR